VASYPDGVLTKEALFAAADKALYEAKSAGRNCVKSAVPKPTGIVR
jgi:PleD family two-component response regulator